MIYHRACYAPGAGEPWMPAATETQARQRATNYSYPVLAMGAGAYFATDMGEGAEQLVELVLQNPDMPFGDIARSAYGYDADAQRHFAHPDVAGAEVWLQRTNDLGHRDYWFAYAGDPSRTPAGGTAPFVEAPRVTKVSPADGDRFVGTGASPKAFFSTTVEGLNPTGMALYDSFGFRVPATVKWSAGKLRATLDPKATLVTKEWYTVRLGAEIHGAWGILVPLEWRFRTKDDGGDGISGRWSVAKALTLRMGTHTGYRFDADGAVTEVLTATLTDDAVVTTDTLRKLPEQSGYWFHVTDGTWDGYWLHRSDVVHLADAPAATEPADATYDPPQPVTVKKGTHTGYQFDARGAMTAEQTITRAWSTEYAASALEHVTNQSGTWFRITTGPLAGYWLRSSDVVLLAG
jgi:hypothetical protein